MTDIVLALSVYIIATLSARLPEQIPATLSSHLPKRLAATLAGHLPKRIPNLARWVVAGLPMILVSFVIGGMRAWPIALFLAIVGGAGAFAWQRCRPASWWLAIQLAVLLNVGIIASHLKGEYSAEVVTASVLGLLAAGMIATVEWGGAFVGLAIEPLSNARNLTDRKDPNTGHPVSAPEGFPGGGQTIGQWERLLIYLFVLVGAPTAVGFLVAAKSILRFGEIKDSGTHQQVEYILIGTLTSFGFALVAAYATRLALAALHLPILSLLSH